MAQIGLAMSYKYLENKVTAAEMAEMKAENQSIPKEKRLQRFYMRSHYSSLYGSQQSGYHHFYLIGPDEQHCTCGLTVPKNQSVEESLGHLDLPSFEKATYVFINVCEFDPKMQVYKYGAICQICREVSATGLNRDQVQVWIQTHQNCRTEEVSSRS